jgi:CHAT domain-containing protein
VGLSDVAAGDALVGLAASLLANGSEWLVASVGPVSDLVAKETMVAFHRALRNGVAPAQALAGAPRDVASDGDLDALAAGAFVCFGAGHRAMWRQPRPDSIAGKCS